jgi:hypothetical protein
LRAILQRRAARERFRLQLRVMPFKAILRRYGESRGWALELGAAGIGLLLGLVLMPILIFLAGAFLLGRYEGASLGHTFGSVYGGAIQGSVASWIVILGPYGLYLLFRALAAWWRASGGAA